MKRGYKSISQHAYCDEKSCSVCDISRRDTGLLLDRFRQWCYPRPYYGVQTHPLLANEKGFVPQTRPWTRRLVLGVLITVCVMFVTDFLRSSWAAFQQVSLPSQDPVTLIKILPSSGSIREYFHFYASEPHMAGSLVDKAQAEWTRDKLVEFGIQNVTIETYYPWLNVPTIRRLAIVNGPAEFLYEAELQEESIFEDPSSSLPDAPPTFHGGSANGNVTGPVVYVNYGRLTDFQFLAVRGVNFTGTIALMRHGFVARGLKVKMAETFGCIGALIYSDPMGDGPFNKVGEDGQPAKEYPNGPWRSASSVERGTVHDFSILPGDSLTPGYPATENATRLLPNETYAMPGIPSLPISWSDALPLFRALEGLGVKADVDWLGGLCEVNYYSGPSVAEANLVNMNDYQIKPVWNVIGRIEGSLEPHRAIILGTHRDAWGFGGADAASGSAIMLELARVFGLLMEQGWKPRRTIILASWDAQTYGVVGSTEWVEDHKDWLDDEAIAYLNIDQAVTGHHFSAQASPLLYQLLYQVTDEVVDSRTGLTVYQAWKQHRQQVISNQLIDPLGGGSDYIPFFQHVGIPSVSMRFHGNYGVYHSNYDSVYWMEHFGDPTYEYHQNMVRIWGLVAVRLADDVLLPLSPLDYATELSTYVATLADSQGFTTFPELSAAVNALSKTSAQFDNKLKKLDKKIGTIDLSNKKKKKKEKHHKLQNEITKANEQLARFERAFIDPLGLPGREWFKHIVYAPGLWTGYKAQVFPSIAEALDQGANPGFTREMEERAARVIEGARSLLKGKRSSHKRVLN